MGTLCEGVNRNAFDEDGWTAFIRAVMEVENLRFADMLAEFENTKDKSCITALHRARTKRHQLMVELSLSVPEFVTGLCYKHGRAAFDIPASSGSTRSKECSTGISSRWRGIPHRMRVLTISSEPKQEVLASRCLFL